MIKTYHIHINGIVQGVGFRPFVYVVAQRLNIKGKVRNDADGVNIWFNANADTATQFLNILTTQAPPKAKILSFDIKEIEPQEFENFAIDTEQINTHKIDTLVSPDFVMCDACRKELYDKNNRRYRYPFITCTQCGPRFSIIEKLPYERYHTAMDSFSMCGVCQKEYVEITDRRYFSQTNSCPACGIQMTLWENKNQPLFSDTESILSYCKQSFEAGKIIAVKGVGGYLLMCDANNANAIQMLRKRKHRPQKPFAILYPNMKRVVADFEISDAEQQFLQNPSGAILLLQPKSPIAHIVAMPHIAPYLNTIGVMLPANPLLDLLAYDFGKPLIATSANLSGAPIIHNDQDALQYLLKFADAIVMNNRMIVAPQDDSVLRFPKGDIQPVFMRRSRGFAPIYDNDLSISKKCILSLGALMKSTFAVSVNKHIFVSQYLGAGGNDEYEETYKKSLFHFLNLYQAQPQSIVVDMHPDYFTHQLGKTLAQDRGVECMEVQHHKAHFAAVLAENKLIDTTEKILGIIWDGTGLGTDTNIWGSECFLFENKQMNRMAHFQYFSHIAGDKLALQPRLSLLSIWDNEKDTPDIIANKFTPQELLVYQKLRKETSIKNSSAGRLIDAVASLLGLCDQSTYEGEAALYLQVQAEKYCSQYGYSFTDCYTAFNNQGNIEIKSILQQIVEDQNQHIDPTFIAAKFHYSLIRIILSVAEKQGVQKIAFSGGVFQNTLLVSLLKYHLGKNFQLYFHHQLSPNDENISLGQLFYVEREIDK